MDDRDSGKSIWWTHMLYWLFCRSWGVDFWCGYVMRENGFVGLQEQSFFFEGECRGEIVGCSVGMDG